MNGVQRRTAAGAVCLVGLLGLAAWGIAATQREQSSDTAFTYRGRLTNAGVAATETVDLEFRLFAQPEGGKPIGALARENVALNEGWFSVDLDFGVNTADGEARFLEIGVRPSGSDKDSVTLAPRQPLGLPLRAWEYPYALYGGESAKATGAPTQAARAEVAPEAVGDWNLSGNAGISSDTNFLGTTDDRPLNFRVNNERAFRLEPGYSPNVVGGYSGNSVRADVNGATIAGGGIPGGSENSVKSDYGFVGGGYANTVGDDAEWTYLNICAVVCGGRENVAQAGYSSVVGGVSNAALGTDSFIGGGNQNQVAGQDAVVVGGFYNSADGEEAAVGGGYGNSASGQNSVVAGGYWNEATGDPCSAVSGGHGNMASASYSAIGGGQDNRASGDSAFVGGGSNDRAEGGNAFIGGGYANRATGSYSTIGGGYINTANDSATVAGGRSNSAMGYSASIGGGRQNKANGSYAAVGGGWSNNAPGNDSCVGGGYLNLAQGGDSVVGGGNGNNAYGAYSCIPGGKNNRTGADCTLSAGYRARAPYKGSFIWSDTKEFDFAGIRNCEFAVRASGGVRFVSEIDGAGNPSHGVYLAAGADAWQPLPGGSDRNIKTDVKPIDSKEVLDKVQSVPVRAWSFTGQAKVRHIGPMAQDFYSAFGLGEDDKHIQPLDANGVALAAIQGLYQLVQEKESRVQALETQNRKLEKRLEALERKAAGNTE